ncbi:MAG: ABC transporter ATP-binding protein [Spirochaetia bacterium]|nr:ABC transporter ATP-binding protein [Spirochaetia bacterium]
MLRVEHLSKTYGSYRALTGVSFQVGSGETAGLLGPNGAGKTTLFRILTGFLPATEGSAWVDGLEIARDPIAVKKIIGYLPETPPLYLDARVSEYLRFAAEIKGVEAKKIAARVDWAMDAVGVKERAGQILGTLSKGYRQRVGLAMAILHDPKLLILDEPTVGLDPAQIAEIRALIKDLARERTILLSSHILSEVSMLCGKIVVLAGGNVLAENTQEGLRALESGDSSVSVRVKNGKGEWAARLGEKLGLKQIVADQDEAVFYDPRLPAITPELVKTLVAMNEEILEVRPADPSLEAVFLKLTK